MKLPSLKISSVLTAFVLALCVAPVLNAQCGLPGKPIKPSAFHPQFGAASPSLRTVALGENDEAEWLGEPSIVGMWHVIFTAHTVNGEPTATPHGMVIDNSVVVWHADGTEIMNSARAAQDGNFCLGIWKRTGRDTYYLNHIPWQGNIYDPSAPADTVGAPQAGGQLMEKIKLDHSGKSYTGTFTFPLYDATGHVYLTFTGTISAKRITPDTPFSDLL